RARWYIDDRCCDRDRRRLQRWRTLLLRRGIVQRFLGDDFRHAVAVRHRSLQRAAVDDARGRDRRRQRHCRNPGEDDEKPFHAAASTARHGPICPEILVKRTPFSPITLPTPAVSTPLIRPFRAPSPTGRRTDTRH